MDFEKERTLLFLEDYNSLISLYDEDNNDFNLFLKELALYKLNNDSSVLSYFEEKRTLTKNQEAFILDLISFYDLDISTIDTCVNIDYDKAIEFVSLPKKKEKDAVNYKRTVGYILLIIGSILFILTTIYTISRVTLLSRIDFNDFELYSFIVSNEVLFYSASYLFIYLAIYNFFLKKKHLLLGIPIIFILVYTTTLLFNIRLMHIFIPIVRDGVDPLLFYLKEHFLITIKALYTSIVTDAYNQLGEFYG